jgi:hypothetical protein
VKLLVLFCLACGTRGRCFSVANHDLKSDGFRFLQPQGIASFWMFHITGRKRKVIHSLHCSLRAWADGESDSHLMGCPFCAEALAGEDSGNDLLY